MIVDVDVNDTLQIHVYGTVVTIHALDVVESVREFQHLAKEVERLRGLVSSPRVLGKVLPDGSVEFRGNALDT